MRCKRIGGGGPENAPGVDSPFRNRSIDENLRLFDEMQDGKHPEGSLLLRAKIDMQHPNMNLRDPPMYRIRFASHHNSGDRWKVYPIYDFAHGNEDSIEGVTHSICTLEFENHRALYDWFLENIPNVPHRPHQKEFARRLLSWLWDFGQCCGVVLTRFLRVNKHLTETAMERRARMVRVQRSMLEMRDVLDTYRFNDEHFDEAAVKMFDGRVVVSSIASGVVVFVWHATKRPW